MSNDPKGSRDGEISPEDRAAMKQRASEIGAGLERVQQQKAQAEKARTSSGVGSGAANVGSGFRYVIELLVGIGFGAGVGYLIDRQFGTQPWGMIVMLFLGFAAGLMNVIRAAQKQSDALPPEKKNAPSVKDDRDD